MKVIYLITTGGTIEKVYSEQTGVVLNVSSKIDRYLRRLRLPDAEINIVPLMNINGLEMTEQDRLRCSGWFARSLRRTSPSS